MVVVFEHADVNNDKAGHSSFVINSVDLTNCPVRVATAGHRSPVLPNVPTLKEAGVKTADVDLRFWFGIFGPKGIPDAVKAKLEKAVATTLANPRVRERLAKLDIEPAYAPGSSLRTKLENEITNWTKFIDAHGIKPE